MRRPLALLMILPALAGCASAGWRHTAAKSEVDAVVQDDAQRARAARAAQSGATATDALAAVADGPRQETPGP